MDANTKAVVEIPLHDLGRRLETVNFLAAIAAGFFVCYVGVWLFLAVTGKLNDLWTAARLLFFVGLLLFWAIAIARMWRWSVFIAALGFSLAWSYYLLISDERTLQGTSADIAVKVMLLSLAYALLFRVARDGWQIARTSGKDRELFTTVPAGVLSFRQALARAAGINPICQWIPQRGRRFIASALFILVALATGTLTTLLFMVLGSMGRALVLDIAPLCDSKDWWFSCGLRFVGATVTVPAIIGGLAGIAVLLRLGARRLARISLESLAMSDKRAPVLFLRSFHDDQVRLQLPKRPLLQRMVALGDAKPTVDHLLVEEGSALGPVIAIGSPSKPAPFGAPRIFFDGQSWRSAVSEMTRAARMVVIVADNTPGVQWELTFIREGRHVAKALYLLPPSLAARDYAQRLILREIAGAQSGQEKVADLLNKVVDPIVGWYQTDDGTFYVLTDIHPSRSSYVCALRIFIRSKMITATTMARRSRFLDMRPYQKLNSLKF